MLGWCVLSLWLFLGRGGVTLAFYLVPLLPFLALSIALVVHEAVAATRRLTPRRPGLGTGLVVLAMAGAAVLALVAYERSDRGLWTNDPVAGQVSAVTWIQRHVPPSSRIVIDDYMWDELHHPPRGEPSYTDAQYYWNVGEDPTVRRRGFADNWRTVNYVVTTPQLVYDTLHNGFPIVTPALEHSSAVAAFNTGGWKIEVRRVNPDAPVTLSLDAGKEAAQPPCMTYA